MYGLVEEGASQAILESPTDSLAKVPTLDSREGYSIGAAARRPSCSWGDASTDKCVEICARMKGRIKAEDLFTVPAASNSSGFRTKSTVGMMLNGCVIDSLVVGGPGYNCGQLDRGDVILKVDGDTVTKDDILDALIGADVPGSEMSLTVQKGGKAGNVRVVRLQRIATERIADRRRLFELFTLMKDRATQLQDNKIPSTVDKCISIWTNMLVADSYYQDKAIKRFKTLQEQCTRCGSAMLTLV